MADKNVQEVKPTGTLWTVSLVLGIIRDVLLIVTFIAVIAGIVVLGPKINAAFSIMGSGGFTQAGQQYGGNNSQGGFDPQSFMLKMKGEVDSGQWEAATSDMDLFNSMSSQFPSGVQQAMHQMEKDIQNHDQASFDSHFAQLMSTYGNQGSTQQGNVSQQNGSQGTGPSDLLGSIFSKIGASDYKVTYNMQASGNTVTMTEYAKGGNTRYDMETSGVSTEIFMLSGQTYSCTQLMGSFTCMKAASSSVPVPAMSAMASSISNYAVTSLPDQYIANTAAKCFTLSGGESGHNGDYCFSSDGILLSIVSSTVTMTATSVERGISDSMFELPATVG